MPNSPDTLGERNVTLFLLFRVFFNARFYYPVFAIAYLDFGLSWTEFFALNAIWAIASIVLEVPSGALADQLGRRTLVITAGALMVVEMLIMCVMPFGGGPLVFGLFLLNRIISGAAEAAASGADEALAYDSIPEAEREDRWSKIQSRLIFLQAVGMVIALLFGAWGYRLNEVMGHLGVETNFSKEFTTRLPFWMCLATAIITFGITLMMREPEREVSDQNSPTIEASFRRTWRTGRWILQHMAPLFILLVLISYDSIVRLYYTVSSSYYRVIDIDPAHFGYIGVAGNLFGMVFAPVVGYMIAKRSVRFNYLFAAIVILIGLVGIAFQIPFWGVFVMFPLGMGMRHIHAATSQYLNRATDSEHRATVLSFRGLAMMLAYCLINLVAIVQVWLSGGSAIVAPSGEEEADRVNDAMIQTSSPWWWTWFLTVALLLLLFRYAVAKKPVDQMLARRVPSPGSSLES